MRHAKRSVADLFGRVAASYDQAGFLHRTARRLVALAGVRPGARVLDVACGNAAALLEAARRAGPDGFVVGVDLAEPMAAEAARRRPRRSRPAGRRTGRPTGGRRPSSRSRRPDLRGMVV